MLNHVLDIVTTIGLYFFLGLSFYGLGHFYYSLGKWLADERPPWVFLTWIGWAISLLIFQIIHFVLPLTFYSVMPLLLIGIFFSIKPIITLNHRPRWKNFLKVEVIIVLIIFVGMTLWIVSKSMLSPTHYDSGLYHFNAIRWLNSYPIIPGLGNLHGRLAYNQSFYTYVAALNFYPHFNHGHSIANSFLFLLSTMTLIVYLSPVFKNVSLLFQSHPFKFLSVLFIFPYLAFLALSSQGFSSPSPDLTSTLIQLIIMITLARSVADWSEGRRNLNNSAIFLIVISTTLITIKLSNLIFAFSILVIVFLYFWITIPRKISFYFNIYLLPFCIILFWVLTGYILSGTLLYPSTLGYLSVEWSVPKSSIIEGANWIYSWARLPNVPWGEVIGNWNWLTPWFARVIQNKIEIVQPFIISTLFLFMILLLNFRKRGHYLQSLIFLPIIPPTLTIIYWFFTAPDPRFLNGSLIQLSTYMVLIFLYFIKKVDKLRFFMFMIGISYIFCNFQFYNFAYKNLDNFQEYSTSGYHDVPQVALKEQKTDSGLTIYTPESGDQCWDSPLPCTPHFNPSLRLISPENILSGFMVGR